ncbi:MAG: hypothetical protein WBY94_17300, partial [Polyangiaceae bacterium]
MTRAWPLALTALLGCGLQRGSIPDAGATATNHTAESVVAEADAGRVPVVPVPPLLSAQPVHK